MSRDLTESLVCCVPYHVSQPRPKRITRDEIGAPTEFRHISHMSGGNDADDNDENEQNSPNCSQLPSSNGQAIKFNDNRRFVDIEAMRSTRTFTVSPAMCLMRLDKIPVKNTRLSTMNSNLYEKCQEDAEECDGKRENHENEPKSTNDHSESKSKRNSLIYTSLTNDKIHEKLSSNTIPMSTCL